MMMTFAYTVHKYPKNFKYKYYGS